MPVMGHASLGRVQPYFHPNGGALPHQLKIAPLDFPASTAPVIFNLQSLTDNFTI
jgi:hypothetical protein